MRVLRIHDLGAARQRTPVPRLRPAHSPAVAPCALPCMASAGTGMLRRAMTADNAAPIHQSTWRASAFWSPVGRAASAGDRAGSGPSRGGRRAHLPGQRGRSQRGRRPTSGRPDRRAADRAGRHGRPGRHRPAGGDVREALGGVDAWVNNAGRRRPHRRAAPLLSRREKLDLLLAVDLRGTMLASWAAADLMRAQPGGGVIINMSWDHVLQGMAGREPGAVRGGEGWHAQLQPVAGPHPRPAIRVNVLGPGWIETAFGARRPPASSGEIARRDPARPLGNARGCGRRGGLPGLRRGPVRHRADDHGERGGCDVGGSGGNGGQWRKHAGVLPPLPPHPPVPPERREDRMATKERTYTDAEIAEKLDGASRAGTTRTAGSGGSTRPTAGSRTLTLVNTIGFLAEAAYHHPDLTVTWAKVWVKLQTHTAGGITDKDWELARKIEDTVLWKPAGRRPRGHAEQVGARRRAEVIGDGGQAGRHGSASASPTVRRPPVLFVTGKLAEPALRRVLAEHGARRRGGGRGHQDHGGGADDHPAGSRRFLTVPPGHGPDPAPRPGRGRPGGAQRALRRARSRRDRRTCARSPSSLRPGRHGRATTAPATSRSSPRSTTPPSARGRRSAPRRSTTGAPGADVIDVGCTPGVPFPELGEVVRELRRAGMRVSIDSFDRAEIRTAVEAGAELVLSVNGSNLRGRRAICGAAARGWS